MTKCTCGGELSSRTLKDPYGGMEESYCLKCGRTHDRQFRMFKDIHFEHDCIHLDKECPFKFGTKCGGHATYPDDYDFPKRDFVCVHNIPKPPPKPRQLEMGDLR